MTVEPRQRRIRSSMNEWFATLAPWIGITGMIYGAIKGRSEIIVPFGGLAGWPLVSEHQRRRNDRLPNEVD